MVDHSQPINDAVSCGQKLPMMNEEGWQIVHNRCVISHFKTHFGVLYNFVFWGQVYSRSLIFHKATELFVVLKISVCQKKVLGWQQNSLSKSCPARADLDNSNGPCKLTLLWRIKITISSSSVTVLSTGCNISTGTVCQELHVLNFITKLTHTSLKAACTMPSISWRDTLPLKWRIMLLLSGSLMEK